MEITITHCKHTPTWDSLQTIIREVTGDLMAKFVQIRRCDNGCNYSAPGEYDLQLRQGNDTILPIKLIVKAVGED